MQKYALVKIKELQDCGITPNSKNGVTFQQMPNDRIITIKKDLGILRWRTVEVDLEWIEEVIEGDISEYLL